MAETEDGENSRATWAQVWTRCRRVQRFWEAVSDLTDWVVLGRLCQLSQSAQAMEKKAKTAKKANSLPWTGIGPGAQKDVESFGDFLQSQRSEGCLNHGQRPVFQSSNSSPRHV